jgi:hypothetical protein
MSTGCEKLSLSMLKTEKCYTSLEHATHKISVYNVELQTCKKENPPENDTVVVSLQIQDGLNMG